MTSRIQKLLALAQEQILATKEENLPIDTTFKGNQENKQNNSLQQLDLGLIENEAINVESHSKNPEFDDVDAISLIQKAEIVILDNGSKLESSCKK